MLNDPAKSLVSPGLHLQSHSYYHSFVWHSLLTLLSPCVQENNDIDLVFHANYESGKTDDLKSDSDINLGFLNSVGEWASISGKADVVLDRAEVKKYYSEGLKAWIGDLGDGKHDGGPDDPRICLIKVRAVTAQYAISQKGMVGSAIQFAKGVGRGDAPTLNKLRYLSKEEIEQCKSLSSLSVYS